jgi:hypothetical protein
MLFNLTNSAQKVLILQKFKVEGLFAHRPVATSTSSRSPISGLSTEKLTSTLNDIIYYLLVILLTNILFTVDGHFFLTD